MKLKFRWNLDKSNKDPGNVCEDETEKQANMDLVSETAHLSANITIDLEISDASVDDHLKERKMTQAPRRAINEML